MSATQTSLEPGDADAEGHEKPVTVHVNTKPVVLKSHKVTGEEIKQAAIAQGVEIQMDFELIEEPHGDKIERKIGDNEEITVTDHATFLAELVKHPKYFLNIEGRDVEWDADTITVPEIRELAGWDPGQEVVEVDLENNTERTLPEDTIVKLKPGHGFAKKVKFQRG
jgi:hypothetical protein